MSHSCEPIDCPACEIPQMARNTLFDGKIMTAQDFLDEQNYFLGKHRRHNQYLHGWGTACGLKVVEHPNPACRDRYVVVQPGAAVDCCGREILVRANAMVDVREAFMATWRRLHGPATPPDDQPHRLEIAIRYLECPADPVPAVFEGCGADASACLPGKLVDGYDFVALLDRPPADLGCGAKRIVWECTNNIDGTHRLALDAPNQRLFVLTGASPAMLVAIDKATKSISASISFAGFTGVDVAAGLDGSHLFVVLQPDGGGDPELRVLNTANLADPPLRTIALVGAAPREVRLLTLSDGRLAAAIRADNRLLVWGTDLEGAAPPAPPTVITIANGLVALAQGPLHAYFYVATVKAEVVSVKLADLTTQALPIGDGAAPRPIAIAVGVRDNRDLIAVADEDAGAVHLFEAAPDAAMPADRVTPVGAPVTGLAGAPRALAFSQGSGWYYALSLLADGSSAVQVVSVGRRAKGIEPSLGKAAAAPRGSSQILVADDLLYLAFEGAPPPASPPLPGGVAIFDTAGDDCIDLLDKVLDACPACEEGDEVVLATIADYVWGDAIEAARIDNRAGRRLLPSTHLLAEIVQCLASCAKAGPPGPAGKDGTNGTGGAGLRDDLPRIVGINWPHAGRIVRGTTAYTRLMRSGLVIAFDPHRPVLAGTLHEQSVLLLRQHYVEPDEMTRLRCYCEVIGTVEGVDVVASCGQDFEIPDDDAPGPGTTGVRFRPTDGEGGPVALPPGTYRVVLEGDHILGEKQIEIEDVDNPGETIFVNPALDANHFAPGVDGRRCPTGDRVEGGRFLSWFTIQPPRVRPGGE
jgi:hypothetical protein